jgi:hypothetical protein
MKNKGTKLIKFISILVISAIIPCMAMNYVVDPLQFYRRSYYFENRLYAYQRYQNPALARSYDYDTVIIGTSMTENFLPVDVERILGFQVLKLSLSAGSAYEQRRTLELAIAAGKTENVIWGIDFSAFRGAIDRTGAKKAEFPEYMYNTNILSHLGYLLNDKTTELSITALARLLKNGPARKYIDVSRYSFWYPYAQFGEENMLRRGELFLEANRGMGQEFVLHEILENVRKNLFSVIRKNPHIEFYLFYTPASVLRELFFIDEGVFEMQLEFKREINQEMSAHENVRLFDFQAAEEIVLDFDRYSDYSHYDLATMVYMLQCMAQEKYLVRQDKTWLKEHLGIVEKYTEKIQ